MINIKKFTALGLSVVLTASLLACGSNSQNPADESTELSTQNNIVENSSELLIPYENCELTFSWWGDTAANDKTLAAIEAFEETYPGITINSSFGTWSGWEDTMENQISAGYTPDISQIAWGWIYDNSINNEIFLDLNTVSEVINLSQFDEKYLDMCTVAEELPAIPISVTGKIFCWDKTTFDKAGISTPTTLDELIAAGTTFRKQLGDDYYPLVLDEDDRMVFLVYYLESVYGKPWIENNKLSYTQSELQTGLEFISSLEASHVIPTIQEHTDNDISSLSEHKDWKNGKYAGIFCWDYEASEFESSLNNGNEFVIGNILNNKGDYKGGFSKINMCYAISESCEHPTEAALFINFLLNSNKGTSIIGIEKGIPLSNAALSYCKEQGYLDDSLLDAHQAILDFIDDEDYKFEKTSLTGMNGVYYDVMAGLSYEVYDARKASQLLYDGIKISLDLNQY